MPQAAPNGAAIKRRKVASGSQIASSSTSSVDSVEQRLATIFASLSGTSDLNPLVDLIKVLNEHLVASSTEDEAQLKILHKGVHFLVRSIQTLLKENRVAIASVNEDGRVGGGLEHLEAQDKAVAQWLQARWNDTIDLLCALLANRNAETRRIALRLLMALQRDASSSLSRQEGGSLSAQDVRGQWSISPWRRVCRALVVDATENSPVADDVIQAFTDDYLQQYDDVRYAFCRSVASLLQETPKDLAENVRLRANAVAYFWGLTAIPTKLDDLNTYLVTEFESSRRAVQKQEAAKGRSKADADSDAEDEVEDWFSDSDEEGMRQAGPKRNGKAAGKTDKSAGLGTFARKAAENRTNRRRLKRNPPFADAVHSLSAQKAAYSRAWLSILLPRRKTDGSAIGGTLDLAATHEALVRLHAQILPYLVKPNLLHDFLVDALDAGGATSLLALNGLFTLMTNHNLNYPAFYTRLYELLLSDPPVLHVRYRSRFLRLLDVFLSSTHLSAALVASFAKRLSRMALRAPPSAIIVVIPFVWNLCKRHKPCLGLIHREFGGDRFDQGPAGLDDPYDALEMDPLKTGAIDSSLWELAAMGAMLTAPQQQQSDSGSAEGQAHFLASVSSISRILAEPFTKERYDLEDFLDQTYATLFETETKKTLNKRPGRKSIEPAVAFDLPRAPTSRKRLPTFPVSETGAAKSKKAKVNGTQANGSADETLDGEDAAADDGVDITSRIFAF